MEWLWWAGSDGTGFGSNGFGSGGFSGGGFTGNGGYQEYHFEGGNMDDMFGDIFGNMFHGGTSPARLLPVLGTASMVGSSPVVFSQRDPI